MEPGVTVSTTLTTPGLTLMLRNLRRWPLADPPTTSTQVQVRISHLTTAHANFHNFHLHICMEYIWNDGIICHIPTYLYGMVMGGVGKANFNFRPNGQGSVWWEWDWSRVCLVGMGMVKSVSCRNGNGACERGNCSWAWHTNSRRWQG